MTVTLVSRMGEEITPAFVKDFKSSMALNAAAVAVISCEHEGRRYGLAATSVTSLSVDPPSILICVGEGAEAHDPIVQAGRFSVSFLAHGQDGISDRFAGFGGEKNEQKFEGGNWMLGETGMPVLGDAAFVVECEIVSSYRIMTHTLHAGAVRAIWQNGKTKPLVYYNRKYVELVE